MTQTNLGRVGKHDEWEDGVQPTAELPVYIVHLIGDRCTIYKIGSPVNKHNSKA